MLSAEQQAEAQKRLKVMAEQQEAEKAIKGKISIYLVYIKKMFLSL